MKFNSLIALILLFQITCVSAQDFRMGKVSIDELQEKAHPLDSTAVAAVLYKKGTTTFLLNTDGTFDIRTEVETRIKIYKKEGLDYANFSINYYTQGEPESVVFNEAATYNLVNNKIEKTKIKKEGEFKEAINEYWTSKKITLPNVKEGSVIEFKYTFKSPYLSTIPDWYFQQEIPVNRVDYDVYIPEFFTYRINLNSPDISTYTEQVPNVNNYKDLRTTYSGRDLPAIRSEEFVTNIRNYAANIKHELATTKFPNTMMKNFVVTWEDVIKGIYDNSSFGGELKQSSYFEDDLKSIITPDMSPTDKMSAILSFVQNKMTWNNRTGYFCSDGVKKAYKTGTGNVAEINLMLTRMLQYAGLNANPVLISTRQNGIAVFPSKNAFNYVISCVELNGKKYLLDATSKYTVVDILPRRAINFTGRLVRENKTSEEIRTTPEISSKHITTAMLSIQDSGEISGKVRHQYTDYEAFDFRDSYLNVSENSYLENLEKKYNGIEIGDDYKRTNSKELNNPLIEEFSITTNNFVDNIGDKLYFSPLLQYQLKRNPFTSEKRNYPIDFVYPFHSKYNLNYTFTDAYQVESLPKPVTINLPNGLGSFKYTVASQGKQIQVAVDLIINAAVISENHYFDLKEFFKHIVDKQAEKIVLKRI